MLSMAFNRNFRQRTLFARHENRLFYPVVFCDGPKVAPAGEIFYTVSFSDGWCKNVAAYDIIGPDFSSIDTGTQLYLGQRVFAYYMGQEHRGSVIDQGGENVRVRLDLVNELIIFTINQLRLSGDIARPHFGSLDSFQNVMKPRPVIADIHIPRGRSQTASPSCEQNRKEVTEDAKDIKAAALALTSLSLSPAVTTQSEGVQKEKFVFPPTTPQDDRQDHEMEQLSEPVDEGYSEHLQKLRTRSFETPKIKNQRKTRAASLDMGIAAPIREHKLERAESWDVEKYQPDNKTARVDRGNKAFKCMWRGCGRVLTSLHGIIRHVKMEHLGPKTDDNVEFYFNDLFIDNETSVSSDDSLLSSGYSDDDGLIESEDGFAVSLRMPVKFQGASNSEAPKSPSTEENDRRENQSMKPERSANRQKSGKCKERVRSSRGKAAYGVSETARKCRKVYGMENRQMWCTQCRWKKACVRFGK